MNNKCEDEMPDCGENVDDKGDEEGDFFVFSLKVKEQHLLIYLNCRESKIFCSSGCGPQFPIVSQLFGDLPLKEEWCFPAGG